MVAPLSLKKYISYVDDVKLSKTRRRINKTSHKGRHYGGISGDQSGAPAMGVSEEETGIMFFARQGATGEWEVRTSLGDLHDTYDTEREARNVADRLNRQYEFPRHARGAYE